MAEEWVPKSAKPVVDEWQPTSARVPVSGHTRKPRGYNPLRYGLESGAAAMGVPFAATDLAIDQLPAIAGTVGLVGGPQTAMLAAGGGAIARQALSNEGPNPMLKSVLPPESQGEGSTAMRLLDVAEQMGMSRAADLLGPGLQWAGKQGSRIAMQLTPEAGKVAIAEGINATKFGLKKLTDKIIGVAGATKAVLNRANAISVASGAPLTWQSRNIGTEVAQQLAPEFEKLPVDADAFAKLKEWNKKFFVRRKAVMSAVELHEMKQKADLIARPIYDAMNKQEIVDPATQAWGMYNKAIADNAREKLAGRLLPDGTRVGGLPGGLADQYAKLNARESGLIRLKDEAFPIIAKGEKGGISSRVAGRVSGYTGGVALFGTLGATQGHSSGERAIHGLIGAGAGALLMSPAVLSQLALAAANPTFARLLALGMRSGAAGVTAPPR